MEIISHTASRASDVTVLDTHVDGEPIRIYVAISPPDLEAVPEIVPTEEFETGVDVHATSVENPEEAWEKIDEVIGNMNPHDIAVFLCADRVACAATLGLLNADTDS